MQVDLLKAIITVGMCVLGILPFVMGRWAEELRPQMVTEQQREIDEFTNAATRKIKRRAVNMVLRKVSHTDVVHLVRALPADEFETFKDFVLPIIAPGKAHNLSESEDNPLVEDDEESMPDSEQGMAVDPAQNGSPKNDKPEDNNPVQPEQDETKDDTQFVGQQPGKPEEIHPAQNGQSTRQNGAPKTGTKPAYQPAKKKVESLSAVAARDEKIRHYVAKNPTIARAKIAQKFNVSERTVARALLSPNGNNETGKPEDNNSAKNGQDSASFVTLETGILEDSKPAKDEENTQQNGSPENGTMSSLEPAQTGQNGHAQHDTGELEKIDALAAIGQQN